MEEKKQGFLSTYKCLVFFVVMAVAAVVVVLVKPKADVYTATAQGYMGDVTVQVSVKDGVITSVVVTQQSETPEIAGAAMEQIPAAIVEKQNVDVDVVSGATYASRAIMTAVADCMKQAGLTPAEIPETTAAEQETESGSGETAGGQESAAISGLTAGTYTASADGYGGEVTVTITVGDDGSITDVAIEGANETPGIGAAAIEQFQTEILENQAIPEAVSGASFTSNAVIAALTDCVEQAGGSAAGGEAENSGSASQAGSLTAGTYTATAQGMGEITVTLTVGDDGSITDVVIDGPDETEGIGSTAIEQLQPAILEAQSADVDIVSSATITSNAVIAAVQDCIEQASQG